MYTYKKICFLLSSICIEYAYICMYKNNINNGDFVLLLILKHEILLLLLFCKKDTVLIIFRNSRTKRMFFFKYLRNIFSNILGISD